MILAIYGLTIFVGSFLLFLTQPMVGKILLPALGGVPAIWTTCMLFFQASLLAGYLYAEKSIKYLGCVKQSVIHLLLMTLGFLALPLNIGFQEIDQAATSPFTWLFARLTVSIGFLFFLIAANAPLIQRWYSQTGQKDSADPYFLYSASNAGSLLALFSYLFLFEPLLSLTSHKLIWSVLYLIQTLLVFFSALILWQNPRELEFAAKDEKIQRTMLSWPRVIRWVLWGFIPCSVMLGVTTHISTDIASGPLLWIFPLSIYLTSFILVFAASPKFREIAWDWQMLPMSVLISIMYFFNLNERAWFSTALHLYFLFTVCMSFHGRLALNRPNAALLNSYYVWMSVGGILGGLFNSAIAPIIFKTQLEYILTIAVAVIMATFSDGGERETDFNFWKGIFAGILVLLALSAFAWFDDYTADQLINWQGFLGIIGIFAIIDLFFRFPRIAGLLFALSIFMSIQYLSSSSKILLIDRSFFGIHKITRTRTDGKTVDPDLKISGEKDIFYSLSHGTTLHGIERKVDVRPIIPLSYYSREGPIGDIFRSGLINRQNKMIGVVGLGCGTIAWYGRNWQEIDFYEIDPKVVEIATNPDYFTYLSRSKAKINIILGDARIKLQNAPDNHYDLLMIDAYSSDSIPVHLLTLEAFQLYRKKLKPDGLLVTHISNRYFKLALAIAPILYNINMHAIKCYDDPKKYSIKYDWYDQEQLTKSHWIAASRKMERVKLLKAYGSWRTLQADPAYSVWTDDYANLLQVYNWN